MLVSLTNVGLGVKFIFIETFVPNVLQNVNLVNNSDQHTVSLINMSAREDGK